MSSPPTHVAVDTLTTRGDELVIGDTGVRELAERAGSTPFFAYDRAAIDRRLTWLRDGMPSKTALQFAVKANPMPTLVNLLAARTDGLDVASAGELRIALNSGARPESISFAAPGKRDAELRSAIATGITLNAESPAEIERIAAIGHRLGLCPRVAIRVNPDFAFQASGMQMGGGPQKFGIDAEAVPPVLARIADLDLHFRGFHIFAGSQNLHSEHLIEAQNATFDLARRLATEAPSPPETLNIGGGFGIPYFAGEEPLNPEPVLANLGRLIASTGDAMGGPEVVLELGRYLVGEAGYYVCRVIDRKVSRGKVFLVTDGGLHHHHLAAFANYDQDRRKSYPLVNAERVHGGSREMVSVVGPLCTPQDRLADDLELGRAQVGNLIAVLQSGAYAYSASPRGFLSHPEPAQLMV